MERSEAVSETAAGAAHERDELARAVADDLPVGTAVVSVPEAGTLAIEWSGGDRPPGKRDRDAILWAIVAEESVVDVHGPISEGPPPESGFSTEPWIPAWIGTWPRNG